MPDVPPDDPGGMGPILDEPPACALGAEPIATVSLSERPIEPTEDQPREAIMGWFDSDEHRDLAVSYGSVVSNALTQILRGTGDDFVADDPAFERTGVWMPGHAADFDEDGRQELMRREEVAYLTPDARLNHTEDLDAGAHAIADIDGDNHADLVSGKHRTLTVRLGGGDGTFSDGIQTPVEAAGAPFVADFDGDGVLDVALVYSQERPGLPGDAAVQLARGMGDGFFATDPIVELPPTGVEGAAADFDCDGKHELVLSTLAENRVEVWTLDAGAATWSVMATLDVDQPSRPLGAEVNGDGAYDLVIASDDSLPQTLLVFPGDAAGGFADPVEVWSASNEDDWVARVTAADLFGDGVQSLIVTFVNTKLSLFIPS